MTDCSHLSCFKEQAHIILLLLKVIEKDEIKLPIYAPDGNGNNIPHNMSSNKDFVKTHLKTLILQNFQNLNEIEVEKYIIQLFNNLDEWKAFKHTLRDLMISMKMYSAQENEIYEQEKKEQI